MVAIEWVPREYWVYWPGLPIALCLFKHLWEALLQDPPRSRAKQNHGRKGEAKSMGVLICKRKPA